TLRCFSLRIQLQQLVGHILHGLLDASLRLGPLLRSQPRQNRPYAFLRAILLNQVQSGEWNVESRTLRILQLHQFSRRAIRLRDLPQPSILTDAVLHVHHVIANRQIAKVRKKRRRLRFLFRRTTDYRIRFIKEIARTEQHEAALRQHYSLRDIRSHQRRRSQVFRKVTGLVGISSRSASRRPTPQPEWHVVLVKDLRHPFQLAETSSRNQHAPMLRVQLLNLFQQRRHGSMESRRRLRYKREFFHPFARRYAELFDVRSRRRRCPLL